VAGALAAALHEQLGADQVHDQEVMQDGSGVNARIRAAGG
jgi:hypothetical protein